MGLPQILSVKLFAHAEREDVLAASRQVIATVCGHEDKTMILRVYGHAELQPDLLQETVRKANQRAVRA